MHICFFDIDGTLILTDGAGQAAFERTFAEDFAVGCWHGTVGFSGRSDRAIVADLFFEYGIANTPENWERFVAGYIERLPRMLAERNGCVLPGIASLLGTLDARPDVALGLLTGNIRAGSDRKLRHFGLADYFPFGGFGDIHADRSEIAVAALDTAKAYIAALGQVQPTSDPRSVPGHDGRAMYEAEEGEFESVLVIGDTSNDIRCARAIGARAVAVATGFSPREDLVAAKPDLLLDDLSDPTPLLSMLAW